MRPRTTREFEVAELSSTLPRVMEIQKQWAKDKCFSHVAYQCAGKQWCTDCGTSWAVERKDEKVRCPHCHAWLTVEKSRKAQLREKNIMTIATVVKGYQVLRHIYSEKTARKDLKTTYFFKEVVQEWINGMGERTVIARSKNISGYWAFHTEMTIKQIKSYYYGYEYDAYRMYGEVYNEVKLLPILKKYGLKPSNREFICSRVIEGLLIKKKENDFELVLKTKQKDVLRHMINKGWETLRYKPSFNICNRNGYKIKDASMWYDYLSLLEYFRKDLRNAFYVCPKNLKKAHDQLLKRKEKIDAEIARRQEIERKIKQALKRKKEIKKFYTLYQPFFGMEIKGNGIIIKPLESVTQFYQEGKAMHHCVFSSRYYATKGSLILSAKDTKGNRLATIELNLKTLKVVQSRAVMNEVPKKNKEILQLLENNKKLIKERISA